MIIAIAVALLIIAVAIFARLEEKLYEAFSDPHWMGFEDREDEDYKSMFSALDSARPTAYEVAKMKQIVLEQEVDEYLKKMEEEK